MKKLIVIALLISGVVCGSASGKPKKSSFNLKTEKDSISYVMGMLIGQIFEDSQIKTIKDNLDMKLYQKVFAARLAGEEMLMEEWEAMSILEEYATKAGMKKLEENRKKGEEYLAQNAKNIGVKVTSSGLQYVVESLSGETSHPDDDSYVVMNLKGRTHNGHVFRDTEEEGEPFAGLTSDFLLGYREGVKMMAVGDKYTLYLPNELGHGEDGADWKGVDPYDVLIYNVELLEILDHDEYVERYGEDYYSNKDNEDNEDREAGDYVHSFAKWVDVDEYSTNNSYSKIAYQYSDNVYLFVEDAIIVQDQNGNELQKVERVDKNDYWDYNTKVGVLVHSTDSDKYPSIFIAEGMSSRNNSDVYTEIFLLANDGTISRIGRMPLSYRYDSYEENLVNNTLIVEDIANGLRFSFDTNELTYTSNDEAITLPAEDIHYIYNSTDGSFKAGGAALGLTYFKRQTLKRAIYGIHSDKIKVFVMGDLNGDGEMDALYTRDDDTKIYINLCKEYKVVNRLSFTFAENWDIDDYEPKRIINRKGEINIFIDNGYTYDSKYYKLVGDKLEEVVQPPVK